MDTALKTDMYELTMLDAAIQHGTVDRPCVFELFARRLPALRRYGVVAGTGRFLEELRGFRFSTDDINWLRGRRIISADAAEWLTHNMRFDLFPGNIYGYGEGETYFPGSPILTVEAPFGLGVLLETLALSIFNHDSAIASAASRMRIAAGDRTLIEMGGRRTHEDAAVASARAAYIGGFDKTSNLLAGRRYGIPVTGTSAHAFTLLYETEAEAMLSQMRSLGTDTTILVDTYDTTIGVLKAVEVARLLGAEGPGAVRLDSGDMKVLVPTVRSLLDELGATGTRIVVTGDLDEYRIRALATLPVDAYGVGTALCTGSGAPTAEFVYKLVEVDGRPVAKKSPGGKATVGGLKHAYRKTSHGTATEEFLSTADDPSSGSLLPGRPLQLLLWSEGRRMCLDNVEDARTRHVRSVEELPLTAWTNVAGDAAIPTTYVN